MKKGFTKAAIYDLARSCPPINTIYKRELQSLQALMPTIPQGVHLDIGTGTGSSLLVVPKRGGRVVTDFSLPMLKGAVEKDANPAVQCDARLPLPFHDHAFELITAIGILEYLPVLDTFFSDVYRIARPGAYFLVTSSPPNLFTWLRCLTGSVPAARSRSIVLKKLHQARWMSVDERALFSQDQFLLVRE